MILLIKDDVYYFKGGHHLTQFNLLICLNLKIEPIFRWVQVIFYVIQPDFI